MGFAYHVCVLYFHEQRYGGHYDLGVAEAAVVCVCVCVCVCEGV